MSTFEKPVTEKQKEVANQIYIFLKNTRRNVTKEEICANLGWDYNTTTDRKIRDTINVLKKKRPIVATPDQKGYFLCLTKDDLDKCTHQWRYIDGIIEDLEETKQPLISFYNHFTSPKTDK